MEITNEVEIAKKAGVEMKRSYRVGKSTFGVLLKECQGIRNLQLFMEAEATPDKRTADALLFSGVDGLVLDNVSIHWNDQKPESAWQHALVTERVRNFRLRDVSARQALASSPLPALRITDCTNGIVTESMAQPGSGTFLSIDGKATKDLLLHTNYLNNARQPLTIGNGVSKESVVYKPFVK